MDTRIRPITSKRVKDMTGQRRGRLLVRGYVGAGTLSVALWLCDCDCGGQTVVTTGELNRHRSKSPKSCGCSTREAAVKTHTKHGMTCSPEHQAWTDMKQRCTNSSAQEWKRYGGRGIKVCEQWLASFEAFYRDVGPRPSSDHSLDREDSDGNYEPGNVRWATRKQQQRNRRCTLYVEYRGERLPLSELAERVGISRHSLKARIKKGMTVDEAVSA